MIRLMLVGCMQAPDYDIQLKERLVAGEIYARQIQLQQAKVLDHSRIAEG